MPSKNPPARWVGDLAAYQHPQQVIGQAQTLPVFTSPSSESAPSVLSQPAAAVLDQHRYAYIGGSLSAYPANGSSSQLIQAQNALRNFLFFRNASATANIYIEFGTDATTNSAIVLQPGQILLFDTVVPQDDVYVLADAASAILRYAYSTLGAR